MIKGLRLLLAAAALALGAAGGASAVDPEPGDFDYYVLALSWSPTWCEAEVAAGDAPDQCAPHRDIGFALHGLWPQYDDGGWPEYCDTAERDPSRGQSAAMKDIMGSPGLAWYQWKKHGRCSGLGAAPYYDLSRRAFEKVRMPGIGGKTMSAEAIESAFLDANPWLAPDDLIVTCAGGKLREARICLSRDLAPQACAADVRADACRAGAALDVPPIP
ncbi:ribonuclease T2 family protein [Amaricoccus solimangrovi]|uniref:Ribonuclease T n=1 Tax=Amaricoccus solimangrovi TaxID=2589815 RepID=A0A501WV42_9RHOB|nr:ribonuclease T2 [Amaricoccus solimangrovi]TPE52270.1 ribonuclease T [Amaricoccus solimangrovi]